MARTFRGDIGLFRLALVEAGFDSASQRSIFNDDSKAKPKAPTRRLKLWFATDVFKAKQAKQWKLEKSLRELFGDRIISMYFCPGAHSWYAAKGDKSLCIKLKDIK
jgi:hypothetical protein